MPPDLSRHTLVWVDAAGPWIALAGSPAAEVQAWLRARRPAVVARRQGDEPNDCARLGIALPPAQSKRRLSLAVPYSAIAHARPPLALAEIAESSPSAWKPALREIGAVASSIALEPRIYGSFAWQALTGERYVTRHSDIDLAWRPRTAAQLHALIDALRGWERKTGRRADGEVVLDNGDAVSWRELAGDTARILVKSACTVGLRARSDLLAALP